MKKNTIIILLTLAVVVSSLTAVSAANTKEDYFDIIDSQLAEIYNAVSKGDFDEARKLVSDIRGDIYDCARYLAEIGEYKNGDILNVYNIIGRAVLNKSEDALKQISNARCLLNKELFGTTSDHCVFSGSSSSEGNGNTSDNGNTGDNGNTSSGDDGYTVGRQIRHS